MRGMILAAGRGGRMGHLTDQAPKPLIKIGDRLLIEYSIDNLAKIGVTDIVINVSYRSDQIKSTLGNGARYGVAIEYSEEATALETGGGIVKALPLLGTDPFIVLSADIITDYPLQQLPQNLTALAHLILVDNPAFHPEGDFCLKGTHVCYAAGMTYTYANIGVYRPALFQEINFPHKFPLGALLKQAVMQEKISGEHFSGVWHNIGTEEDLLRYLHKNY